MKESYTICVIEMIKCYRYIYFYMTEKMNTLIIIIRTIFLKI